MARDVLRRTTAVDTSTPAVVLKFDPNPMHHGGLGAIRSLGRLGVPVYGVHELRLAPAAASRYLYGRWFWRPDPDNAEKVLTDLAWLADRIGRPAVLVPTDDAGSIFLAEHGTRLRDRFLFPAPPAELPRRLADKFAMFRMCQLLGVPSPETVVPSDEDEARSFANRVGFPLVAKLVTPWTGTGKRLHSTSIVRDTGHLDDLLAACERAHAELMLQEFIPGGPGQDWFFHGYLGRDGRCLPAFTGVKERSYPAHAGLTSMGRSAPNARLRDEVVRMLTRLRYQGIVDIDVRFDARDGQYKMLDVNPRLGAQFRLFRDTGGIDVVLAQYLDLTGQPIAEHDQVSGRGFVVENYDPIAAFRYWRDGELSLRCWLASLRGGPEPAWFAHDDPLPFALMCLRMGWRAISRPFGGGGSYLAEDQSYFLPGPASRRAAGWIRPFGRSAPPEPPGSVLDPPDDPPIGPTPGPIATTREGEFR